MLTQLQDWSNTFPSTNPTSQTEQYDYLIGLPISTTTRGGGGGYLIGVFAPGGPSRQVDCSLALGAGMVYSRNMNTRAPIPNPSSPPEHLRRQAVRAPALAAIRARLRRVDPVLESSPFTRERLAKGNTG